MRKAIRKVINDIKKSDPIAPGNDFQELEY